MRKALQAGGRNTMLLGLLPLLFLLVGQHLAGQTAVQPETATISVDVDLVVLHATVRDRKGGFVSGLQNGDFQVFEDGVPQVTRVFQHEDVPVTVGLVVDNSGSMRRKRNDVVAAALIFVRSSNPKDELFVVNFNERVSFGLPDTQLFSASADDLTVALKGVPAEGETALYDAIEAGLEHEKVATLDKKVLIVVSDGGDNASHHTLDQVLKSAGLSDAVIYTVGLFDEDDADRNPGVLRSLAQATGGEAFLPRETSDVVQICRRIAEDIRNQYTIGYVPTNQKLNGAYRTVRVTASRHGQKLLVRARAGYFASPERKNQPPASAGPSR